MANIFTYYKRTANNYYHIYDNGGGNFFTPAQIFSHPLGYTITQVRLHLMRQGSGGSVTVGIRAIDPATGKPTGSNLCESTVDCTGISTVFPTGEWVTFAFGTPYELSPGISYAIVAKSAATWANKLEWLYNDTNPLYPRGQIASSGDDGSTWALVDKDENFEASGNIVGDYPAITVLVGTRDSILETSVWAYDDDNNLLWTYDTGGNTSAVVMDGSDNVYVVGAAADNGDGGGTRNLWKLDKYGNFLDGRHVGSSDNAVDVCLDSLGRIIIACKVGAYRVAADLASEENIVSAGALDWFYACTTDLSDNSIYIGSGGTPLNIYKYNSSLVEQWTKDPHSSGFIYSLDMLSNGNVVAGFSGTNGVYCWNSAGTEQWHYTGISDHVNAVRIDGNNLIYLGTDNAAKSFICLNSSGVEQWFAITGDDDVDGIFINGSNVPFVCGQMDQNITLWKVNPSTHAVTKVLGTSTTANFGIHGSSTIDPPNIFRFENYVEGDNTYQALASTSQWIAQTFTPDISHKCSRIRLRVYRDSSDSPGILTVSIRATDDITGHPTVPDLVSGTLNVNSVVEASSGRWYNVEFATPYILMAGKKYAIVCRCSNVSGVNKLNFLYHNAGTYAGGNEEWSTDSGFSWTTLANNDLMFEEWGTPLEAPVITDQSASSTALRGEETSLFVTATGDPTPTYQWYLGGVEILGETNSTITLYPTATGTYTCIVTNVVTSAESDPIVLTVVGNPYRYNPFNMAIDLDRTN